MGKDECETRHPTDDNAASFAETIRRIAKSCLRVRWTELDIDLAVVQWIAINSLNDATTEHEATMIDRRLDYLRECLNETL